MNKQELDVYCMQLKTTHLYRFHLEHSHLTTYAGFKLPLWYDGIIQEHLAVRNSAGLWDVSHMGRLAVSGKDATRFMDFLLTTSVSKLPPKRTFYSLICSAKGAIIDDVVVLKKSEEDYLMVVNASNRVKDIRWLLDYRTSFDIAIKDISDEIALLSLQGPRAEHILQKSTGTNLSDLRRYYHTEAKLYGYDVILSRTGYTGEDGFEILILDCPVNQPIKAQEVWEKLLSRGAQPCGLGARDTLRLEAGMCLYGQDISEYVTPIEAGLIRLISFEKSDFVGKHALLIQKRGGASKVRVCFTMRAAGIPRSGCKIFKCNREIGGVTSGTFSPLIRKGIGMGYVQRAESIVGGEVDILVRGSLMEAILVNPPFYDQTLYGYKRKRIE